ncbi:MAG: universal stress protein [Solirubrobacteraceae bacterium]
MRALVWIAENTWEACVEGARALLPPEAAVTLLHVAPSDVEELAASGHGALLGRHPRHGAQPPVRAIAQQEAEGLLQTARERLGRDAELLSLRGRVEREVVTAAAGADLLVLARDGEHRPGPKSLGRWSRFVTDHAPCPVLLVWAPGPRARPTAPAGPPPPPAGSTRRRR